MACMTARSPAYTAARARSNLVKQRARCVPFSGAKGLVVRAQATNGASALPSLPPLNDNYEQACAFASYANWIIPGHVLVGRYPYVEPSRCTTREQGEEQVRRILEAGINTFISLQAELPPQDAMTVGGSAGFLPYKSVTELVAASMNPPQPREILEGLRNPHLDKFLPPKKKAPSPDVAHYSQKQLDLHFLHSPIVDLGIPSQDKLFALIQDINACLKSGQRLYIHCWGGRGRAGTVAACMMGALYNVSAEEAIERVQRAFDTRKDSERRSPETDEQHQLVKEFIKNGCKPAAVR